MTNQLHTTLAHDEIWAAMEIQKESYAPVVCLVRDFGGGPWLWVWPPGAVKNPDALARAVQEGINVERTWRDRFIKLVTEIGFERAAEQVEKELETRCRCLRLGQMH
jgi:hypothetical protein